MKKNYVKIAAAMMLLLLAAAPANSAPVDWMCWIDSEVCFGLGYAYCHQTSQGCNKDNQYCYESICKVDTGEVIYHELHCVASCDGSSPYLAGKKCENKARFFPSLEVDGEKWIVLQERLVCDGSEEALRERAAKLSHPAATAFLTAAAASKLERENE